MINMVKLPTNKSSLFLRVAKGHFATSHSHINYYIDVTTQKARLSEAKAVAKELVAAYQHNTIVDTVLCLWLLRPSRSQSLTRLRPNLRPPYGLLGSARRKCCVPCPNTRLRDVMSILSRRSTPVRLNAPLTTSR